MYSLDQIAKANANSVLQPQTAKNGGKSPQLQFNYATMCMKDCPSLSPHFLHIEAKQRTVACELKLL